MVANSSLALSQSEVLNLFIKAEMTCTSVCSVRADAVPSTHCKTHSYFKIEIKVVERQQNKLN